MELALKGVMYCVEVNVDQQRLQQGSRRHTCDLRFMAADVRFLGSQCAQIELSAVQLWCGLQLLQGGAPHGVRFLQAVHGHVCSETATSRYEWLKCRQKIWVQYCSISTKFRWASTK